MFLLELMPLIAASAPVAGAAGDAGGFPDWTMRSSNSTANPRPSDADMLGISATLRQDLESF
jgi:hypothetical protein